LPGADEEDFTSFWTWGQKEVKSSRTSRDPKRIVRSAGFPLKGSQEESSTANGHAEQCKNLQESKARCSTFPLSNQVFPSGEFHGKLAERTVKELAGIQSTLFALPVVQSSFPKRRGTQETGRPKSARTCRNPK